jgi:YD repeat-containing protein
LVFRTQLSSNGWLRFFGEPTTIVGDPITQADQSVIHPSVTVGYDAHGNATSYNVATGPWYFNYSTDNLNRLVSVEDPDGIFAYQYWYPNGQLAGTETSAQHALEAKSPGSGRVTYAYDPDGNAVSETHHNGGVAGTTQKWYDGVDRLVESSLPVDPTDAYYPAPWLTRYKYDITAGGTDYITDSSGAQHALAGHGGVFAVGLYIPLAAAGAPNTGWVDASGVTRDQLDRVTASYDSMPASGRQPFEVFSNGYDGTPSNKGWLTSTVDALGHSATLSYDGAGRTKAVQYSDGTPSATFTYTPDGQLAAAASGTLGTEAYTYDLDGKLQTYTEPKSSTSFTSPATFTFSKYADGSQEALSVSSSALSVSNLFNYVHRVDGMMTKEIVNYSAGGRSQQTFTWKYSPAGRFVTAGDNIKAPSSTVNYDINGQASSFTIPAGFYPSLTYDPEGYRAAERTPERARSPRHPLRADGADRRPDRSPHRLPRFANLRLHARPVDLTRSRAGSLDDALSYRRYLYDHGNSLTNADGSGDAPCPGCVPPGDIGCVATNASAPSQNNVIGAIIGAIGVIFGALFGGLLRMLRFVYGEASWADRPILFPQTILGRHASIIASKSSCNPGGGAPRS